MESIKEMVDVNTIVGDPVEAPDGNVIIPISRVSFGFASGGGDHCMEKKQEKGDRSEGGSGSGSSSGSGGKYPFAGGAGAGVSVQPVAFMVVGNGQMRLLPVDQRANMIDNLIASVPSVLNQVHRMFCNKEKEKESGLKPVKEPEA